MLNTRRPPVLPVGYVIDIGADGVFQFRCGHIFLCMIAPDNHILRWPRKCRRRMRQSTMNPRSTHACSSPDKYHKRRGGLRPASSIDPNIAHRDVFAIVLIFRPSPLLSSMARLFDGENRLHRPGCLQVLRFHSERENAFIRSPSAANCDAICAQRENASSACCRRDLDHRARLASRIAPALLLKADHRRQRLRGAALFRTLRRKR